MHEAFRQLVPVDFHGTYNSKNLYGSCFEHFGRSEVTNVLQFQLELKFSSVPSGFLSLILIDP